jgi:hypothetical protein
LTFWFLAITLRQNMTADPPTQGSNRRTARKRQVNAFGPEDKPVQQSFVQPSNPTVSRPPTDSWVTYRPPPKKTDPASRMMRYGLFGVVVGIFNAFITEQTLGLISVPCVLAMVTVAAGFAMIIAGWVVSQLKK